MLDRVDGTKKWSHTPMKDYQKPKLTARIWKTLLSVLITSVIYKYLCGGRNPCFALIGAVYGIGSQFQEGFYNGFNRFIGTFVGGFLVIPFHWLYINQPFGLPDWIWLVLGLILVIWCNLALGADSAIQPGTVIYFVVLFTVGKERVVSYTFARIADTGVGVFIALFLTMIRPSKADKEKGLTFSSWWLQIKYSFFFFKEKNRKARKQEEKDFGM